MSVPIKVEVFTGSEELPHTTYHYGHFRELVLVNYGAVSRYKESLQRDFETMADFPTPERLIEVFITNAQNTYTKIWLDEEGTELTRVKFTKTFYENSLTGQKQRNTLIKQSRWKLIVASIVAFLILA